MANNGPWAHAWQQLLNRHTPFRPAEDEDFQGLLRQLTNLEETFLERPELRRYYDECMRDPKESEAAREHEELPDPDGSIAHVCAMQIQLMEDTFYSLKLEQYANALDNRGWMNLFRRWGNSPTFRARFRRVAGTFSKEFVDFYEHFIEGWPPIDEAPVPHPWDFPPTREPMKLADLYPDIDARWAGVRVTRGTYLDPGRREAGTPHGGPPPRPEEAHTPAGAHGKEGLLAQSEPPAGGQSSPPPPPPPPVTGSNE